MNPNLESESQRQAAAWVRDLPAEAPSLAWRAALNETVRAEAARRVRRRRTWLFATPGLGFAAAALAFVVVSLAPRRADPVPAGRVEASLVALYEESARTDDIVGAGPRPWEAPSTPALPATDSSLDLEAL